MSFFDNVKNAAKNVAQKSSETIETTKLNMSINQEKDKIKKVYTEIGTKVYESFESGEDVGVLVEFCNTIQEYKNVIEELEAKKLLIKNANKCTGCGAEVSNESAFCPKCGTKYEIAE